MSNCKLLQRERDSGVVFLETVDFPQTPPRECARQAGLPQHIPEPGRWIRSKMPRNVIGTAGFAYTYVFVINLKLTFCSRLLESLMGGKF